jgi:hypothetical protein
MDLVGFEPGRVATPTDPLRKWAVIYILAICVGYKRRLHQFLHILRPVVSSQGFIQFFLYYVLRLPLLHTFLTLCAALCPADPLIPSAKSRSRCLRSYDENRCYTWIYKSQYDLWKWRHLRRRGTERNGCNTDHAMVRNSNNAVTYLTVITRSSNEQFDLNGKAFVISLSVIRF